MVGAGSSKQDVILVGVNPPIFSRGRSQDIARGPDGFLWLATHVGLVRFDGERFETFTTNTTAALTSNRIRRLARSPAGDLWIASSAGVVRYDNTTLHRISQRGVPYPQGSAWVPDATMLMNSEPMRLLPTAAFA